jgi:hypothetical protein
LVLDLFDRRFPIYEAATAFFAALFTHGRLTDQDFFTYVSAVRTSEFLFDKEMADYLLDTVGKKATLQISLNSELDALPVGEERRRNLDRQAEIKKWFDAEHQNINQRFSKFLQLKHWMPRRDQRQQPAGYRVRPNNRCNDRRPYRAVDARPRTALYGRMSATAHLDQLKAALRYSTGAGQREIARLVAEQTAVAEAARAIASAKRAAARRRRKRPLPSCLWCGDDLPPEAEGDLLRGRL